MNRQTKSGKQRYVIIPAGATEAQAIICGTRRGCAVRRFQKTPGEARLMRALREVQYKME